MGKLIDVSNYPVSCVLGQLLEDKSSKKSIIWATDTYEDLGEGFTDKDRMDANLLFTHPNVVRPRIEKSIEDQAARTRKKAEVFTPTWICNRMNNVLDEDWFGRKDVFNTENEDHSWTVAEGKIEMPEGKTWHDYIDSIRLEITCGEAPYLMSRYDVSAEGEIIPPRRRIGILDRKLRIVNENTETRDEWIKWAIRAVEASYGYEYQGDSVLIARINILLTFVDCYEERWNEKPDEKLLQQIANRIAWNIWQMDGFTDTVPLGKPYEESQQLSLFDAFEDEGNNKDEEEAVPCRIFNWRSKASLRFMDLKEKANMGKKLFDYVIGNPPYQEETKDTSDKPVYNLFMDGAIEVSDKVELITPARFLFNAGKTPKDWNRKMLSDEHFKVLHYEQNSGLVFSNTDIKGGIAVTYRDAGRDFGAIEVFTHFEELNSIKKKVAGRSDFSPLSEIIYPQNKFNLDVLYGDHPEYREIVGSGGSEKRLTTKIFEQLSVFTESKNNDSEVKILGLIKNKRVYKYISRNYLLPSENLDCYKVLLPKSNGSGAIGEVLSTPLVGEPLVGHTQSFISIGACETREEADALLKYIKSKFARTMLGILKITQDNPTPKWKYVPLQDFTENSDIDWSKSVHDIDLQLYAKYGLDDKEIKFIENHVKEME